MVSLKKKAIWYKPRVRRGAKLIVRVTKFQLLRKIYKVLSKNSFIAARRPAQKATGCFKSTLVQLHKSSVTPRRVLQHNTVVVTARADVPGIIHTLCRTLGVGYKTAASGGLRKYVGFYASAYNTKTRAAENSTGAHERVDSALVDVKKKHLVTAAAISSDAAKKPTGHTQGQHSKNWIDPEVWRKMPRKDRDDFLIKIGKRPGKHRHAK